MTAVADEAPAGDDTATAEIGPQIGLTPAEAEIIQEARLRVCAVWQAVASRVFAAQLPGAEQRVKDAEAAEAEAREALAGPQAIADQLRARLAECVRKGEECQLASEDDDLEVCITARSRKIAYEQTAEDLEKRVQVAQRVADPLAVVLIAAEREVKAARHELAVLADAVRLPFFTGMGMATPEYESYLLHTGAWWEDGGTGAEKVLTSGLKRTGMGAEIEKNAIRAYVAGDPAAVAIGGSTRRWKDGTTLHYVPGSPPVVSYGEATAQDLAHAPVVNTAPALGAAEVMGGMRHAAGWSPR